MHPKLTVNCQWTLSVVPNINLLSVDTQPCSEYKNYNLNIAIKQGKLARA